MIQRQISTAQGAEGREPRARGCMADAAASAAAHATTADTIGRIDPETVTLLTRAGFARHFVPRAWHGDEGTFTELLTRVAAIGEGCASAAWCAALWAVHGRYAAQLPPEGQRDLWGDSPDIRISAGLRPSGRAVPHTGGWLLSGVWPCVSGVRDADWLLLAAPEERGGTALPGCRLFAVPAAAVDVRESWHSTGMRATAGHTAVLDTPLLVPEHRTSPLPDVLSGLPGPGRSHTTPAHLGTPLLLCAPALGAARQALRAWTCWAATRGDRSTLHLTLAGAADDIDAADLKLTAAAHRADSGTRAAHDVAHNRRTAAAAAHHLVTAVERLFCEAGVHACATPGPLERAWRDIHVVAAHQALRRETAATAYAHAVFEGPERRGDATPPAAHPDTDPHRPDPGMPRPAPRPAPDNALACAH